jgi:tryptophan 2,3-dioxygenase
LTNIILEVGKNRRENRLSELFNGCIDEIVSFRSKHIQIVVSFIVSQSRDVGKEKGTGGSSLIPWLKQIREEADEVKIKII